MDWTIESVYEDTHVRTVNVICPEKLTQATLNAICNAVNDFRDARRLEMVLFTWPSLQEFVDLDSHDIH